MTSEGFESETDESELNDSIEDHILEMYEVLELVGDGAYGIVWRARDKATGKTVALKKVFDAFQNREDAQKTYREIAILRFMRWHEDTVHLVNAHPANNKMDVYLVFEYWPCDLYSCLNQGVSFRDAHRRFIMYQLLRGLAHLHSANVLHRDVKTGNILVNHKGEIRLCDFGLSRTFDPRILRNRSSTLRLPGTNLDLTGYIATLRYRAPELLLGSRIYDGGIDVWAAGCVLGQLLTGEHLFAGDTVEEQIARIFEVRGKPTLSDIVAMKSKEARPTLSRLGIKLSHTVGNSQLRFSAPSAPGEAIDLLEQLTHINPTKRVTAKQALKHPYFRHFRRPETEKPSKVQVSPDLCDSVLFSVDAYRDAVSNICRDEEEINKNKQQDPEAFVVGQKLSELSINPDKMADIELPYARRYSKQAPRRVTDPLCLVNALSGLDLSVLVETE